MSVTYHQPLPDSEALGEHENGFHIGAFVMNLIALPFALYLLVIHQDDPWFPNGNIFAALVTAAVGALPPMVKFRSPLHATIVLVVSYVLAFLAWGVALATWFFHNV